MNRFKQCFKEQTIVGVVEYIEIDGIGKFKAKIDSGNEGYNVIHGTNISKIDKNKIKFQTIDGKTVSFELKGTIRIHAGKSEEERPVIHLNFKLGNHFFSNIPFSVTDRSHSEEPILIGEPFLKKIDAMIDVNKHQLQESKKKYIKTGGLGNYITPREKYERALKIVQKYNDEHARDVGQPQSPEYIEALRIVEKLKPIEPEKARQALQALRMKLKGV